jgi:hypothetical protein
LVVSFLGIYAATLRWFIKIVYWFFSQIDYMFENLFGKKELGDDKNNLITFHLKLVQSRILTRCV